MRGRSRVPDACRGLGGSPNPQHRAQALSGGVVRPSRENSVALSLGPRQKLPGEVPIGNFEGLFRESLRVAQPLDVRDLARGTEAEAKRLGCAAIPGLHPIPTRRLKEGMLDFNAGKMTS